MSSTAAVEAEETEEGTASSARELDQIFAIFQNHRRRLVLEYLRDRDSTTQGELARHVAAVENDVPEDAVTSTQRKRVYVSLYQAHLPKLDRFGAISFDQDRGTVERTSRTDELLTYLDRFETEPAAPRSPRTRSVWAPSSCSAARSSSSSSGNSRWYPPISRSLPPSSCR